MCVKPQKPVLQVLARSHSLAARPDQSSAYKNHVYSVRMPHFPKDHIRL